MIYKIKHKVISETYPADALVFLDDVYVLNYLEYFSVVAKRDSSGKLVHGSSFCEILNVEERSELKTYLYDERTAPLILRTDIGTAIVSKYLAPSTLLFIVSFLCSEKNGELLKLISKGKIREVILPSFYDKFDGRITNSKRLTSEFEFVMNNLNNLIEYPKIVKNIAPKNTVENFKNVVSSISDFCGCSVTVDYNAELVCDSTFDVCAFKGFLISMFMLARRRAFDRHAKLELASCSEGISARVIFLTDKNEELRSCSEIFVFRDIAERNNMLFEAAVENGVVNVRFCPTRKDWSLIELKSPSDFDWDS